MVQWSHGPIWSNGRMVQWSNGLVVQSYNGPMFQWSNKENPEDTPGPGDGHQDSDAVDTVNRNNYREKKKEAMLLEERLTCIACLGWNIL